MGVLVSASVNCRTFDDVSYVDVAVTVGNPYISESLNFP